MSGATPIQGRICQADFPSWEPLLAVLGHELASWFMWMFEIELTDNTRLHAYKHVATRRYLIVDAGGHAYADDRTGCYLRQALPAAIGQSFAGWELADPSERHLAILRVVVTQVRRAA